MGRNNSSVLSLVELADLLALPVIDRGARLNFPNTYPLNLTGGVRELVASAVVILGLDVMDLYGGLARYEPKTRGSTLALKPSCKVIHVTLADLAVRSLTTHIQE